MKDDLRHSFDDARCDEALRSLGGSISEPTASPQLRAGIENMLRASEIVQSETPQHTSPSDTLATTVRNMRRMGFALAACLAIVAFLNVMTLSRVRDIDARFVDRSERILPARTVATPWCDGEAPRYVLVNFDHNMCPRAAEMTPLFNALEDKHCGDPILFVNLDMSSSRVDQAVKLATSLGIQCIFDAAPGSETGVIKIVDRSASRVVLTANKTSDAVPDLERVIAKVCRDADTGGWPSQRKR